MPNLYVAIWSIVPRADLWRTQPLMTKYGRVLGAVQEAEQRLARRRAPMPGGGPPPIAGGVRWIFLTPEYTFSYSGALAPHQGHAQISGVEQEQIKAQLSTLSARYDDLLLVPGTVAFRKPAVGRGVGNTRVNKILDGHRHHGNSLPHLATAQPHVAHDVNVALAASRLQAQASAARLETHRRDAELARNTAYGYFQGGKVLKCHKQADIGETNAASPDLHFARGTEVARWRDGAANGLHYGLEICADASHGVLKQSGALDIHIVVADGLDLAHTERAPATRFVLLADPGSSGVWDVAGAQAVQPFRRHQYDGYTMQYFELLV
jgi:hypothetical protein